MIYSPERSIGDNPCCEGPLIRARFGSVSIAGFLVFSIEFVFCVLERYCQLVHFCQLYVCEIANAKINGVEVTKDVIISVTLMTSATGFSYVSKLLK